MMKNHLAQSSSDVLEKEKVFGFRLLNSPSPFISFWDNHLFVYSDEHYRWCSKFFIIRNKIDLASVKRESGELLKHLLEIAWSQLSDHLLKRRRRRKYHQFIVEWWQHVPDTLHWSHFLGSRSNHLNCNSFTLYTKWPIYSRPCNVNVNCFSLWL